MCFHSQNTICVLEDDERVSKRLPNLLETCLRNQLKLFTPQKLCIWISSSTFRVLFSQVQEKSVTRLFHAKCGHLTDYSIFHRQWCNRLYRDVRWKHCRQKLVNFLRISTKNSKNIHTVRLMNESSKIFHKFPLHFRAKFDGWFKIIKTDEKFTTYWSYCQTGKERNHESEHTSNNTQYCCCCPFHSHDDCLVALLLLSLYIYPNRLSVSIHHLNSSPIHRQISL